MNPTPAELRTRGGIKWTFYPEGVLAAWVAEMDFGLAPPIANALHAAIDRGDTGYHYPAAERQTAEAATEFWRDRFGWDISPAQVFAAPDVVEGIRRAIAHLTRPGSPVILHTPVYHPFFSMVERAGRTVVPVLSTRGFDGQYALDLEGVDRAFGEGAGSIVLCNPWNPTGRCLTREEVSSVVEIATRHAGRVIADEVHAPLTRSGHEHVVAHPLSPDTVVTVTSASKAWNIPGLKCAQVVLTRSEDIAQWTERYYLGWVGVSVLGLVANGAAYGEGGAWLDGIAARLDDNRRLLDQLMSERLAKVGYASPEGTYLAWLDFRSYGLDDPAGFLLENGRVALAAGAPFGPGGEGHARLNFATTPQILTEIVDRMANALGALT